MASVYIETTIPSYYFETRKNAEAVAWRLTTVRWWQRARDAFELVTSSVVDAELDAAPSVKAQSCKRLIATLPRLDVNAEVTQVAKEYIAQRLVPRRAVADSFHLALASVHRIDHLLTWNCKHLANVNKAKHLAVINRRLGLTVPTVATPYTLLPENIDGTEAADTKD